MRGSKGRTTEFMATRAVVAMLSADVALLPLIDIDAGEKLQAAPLGKPLQAMDTF